LAGGFPHGNKAARVVFAPLAGAGPYRLFYQICVSRSEQKEAARFLFY
jgi:hypothetical protein